MAQVEIAMWFSLLLSGALAASPPPPTPASSDPSTVRPVELDLGDDLPCERAEEPACELRPDCHLVKTQSPSAAVRDVDGHVAYSMGSGSTQVRCEPVEVAPKVLVLGVEAALCQDSGGTWRTAEGARAETCDCPASAEGEGRGTWDAQLGCGLEGLRCREVGGAWDMAAGTCTRGGRLIDARFARPLSEG